MPGHEPQVPGSNRWRLRHRWGTATGGGSEQGEVISVDAGEVASLLSGSKEIMIVPGYGMAVAQAQHIVARSLRSFAIRVLTSVLDSSSGRADARPYECLLAEARVPTNRLRDGEINEDFPNVDVSIIIGANDIVTRRLKGKPG
ncbi:MAG: hypothetical protein CM1200mP36_09810 [Gammaproteobacteria bacterium]|nr:MAG: hypothetical protein CM1200mP36_09810 [Gammaproteobacteria bacterium]